jgi:hypothetical protein
MFYLRRACGAFLLPFILLSAASPPVARQTVRARFPNQYTSHRANSLIKASLFKCMVLRNDEFLKLMARIYILVFNPC